MLNKFIRNNDLILALNDYGIKELSPVQEEVINSFYDKRNVVVKSKTGSGKTHSFLIPLIDNFKNEDNYALIIAPTNELAFQIFQKLEAIKLNLDIRLYDKNLDSNKEATRLEKKSPNIVVGTIGKLYDLIIKKNALKAYQSKYVVIDEADMCFNGTYDEELFQILEVCENAKKMLFSATFEDKIKQILPKVLKNPLVIDLDNTYNLDIKHIWLPIRHNLRIVILEKLLECINPYLAIIFVNKKETVPFVYKLLSEKGYNVCAIHKDQTIRERKRILKEIDDLKYQYIISTDISARGIDFKGVSHIINYDLPYDYEFYIHRSGRTGRMNTNGICYTLFDKLDDNYLNMLAKKGVTPIYMDIVNKELVPYKGRNVREKRVAPTKDYVKLAKKHLKLSSKVKPGYKKKHQQKVMDLAERLKRNDKGRKRK